MPASTPFPDIAVIGAGALGLATAAELARRGNRVTVIDPGGPNASSVAAGMLAPAMESLLDDCTAERAALLKAARDLWPDFAARTGIELMREGSRWVGPDASAIARRLSDLGFEACVDERGAFTPEDWRLDPVAALSALTSASGLSMAHGRVVAVEPADGGWLVHSEAGVITVRAVVLAAGWSAGAVRMPEPAQRLTALIQPIRGQIERFAGSAPTATLRGPEGYLAPSAAGFVAGASMDAGETELTPDPALAARHRAMVRHRLGVQPVWRRSEVGVRGASPDGLPLAGLVSPGLALALAPRRNGWLLAPMVAQTVADALEGLAPPPWAAALDPARVP